MAKSENRRVNIFIDAKAAGKSIRELRQEQKKLNKEIQDTPRGTQAYLDRVRELRQVNGQLAEHRQAVSGVNNAWSRVRDTAKGVLVGLTAAFGAQGVISILKSSLKTIIDFQKEGSKLEALLIGVSNTDLEDLKQDALEIGANSAKTATEVRQLQVELSKLGFDPQQILLMSESIVALSTAFDTDLAQAATVTGATLRQFGLEAEDAQRVNDVMAKAFVSTALDMDKFAVAMAKAGPVARTFGFSLEDTTALLGQLVNSGLDASTAGTALKNIFLNLADENGKLAQSLGGPVTNLEELTAGLKKLEEGGISLGEALELTDARSVTAFETFLKGADSLESLAESINGVDVGTVQQIAETQMDNLAGDVTLLGSAWDGFILSLEDGSGALGNALRGLVQGLTDFLGFLTKNAAVIRTVVGLLIKLAGVILIVRNASKAWLLLQKLVNASMGRGRVGILLYSAATNVMKGNLKKAGAALKLFGKNMSLSLGAVGLIIVAIEFLVSTISSMIDRFADAASSQEILADATEEASKKTAGARAELEKNLAIARDVNISDERRLESIEAINKALPEGTELLTLQNAATEEGIDIINDHIAALEKQALAEVLQEKLKENIAAKIDAENSELEDNISWWEEAAGAIGGGLVVQQRMIDNKANSIAKLDEEKASILDLITAQEKEEDSNLSLLDTVNQLADGRLRSAQILADQINAQSKPTIETLKVLRDELKVLKGEFEETEIGTTRFDTVQVEIKELEKRIKELTGTNKKESKKRGNDLQKELESIQKFLEKARQETLDAAAGQDQAELDQIDRKFQEQIEAAEKLAKGRGEIAKSAAASVIVLEDELEKALARKREEQKVKRESEEEKKRQEALKKELDAMERSEKAKADLAIVLAGDNERDLLTAKVNQISLIRDLELKNLELTENEKKLIVARAEGDIDRLKQDFANKELARQQMVNDALVDLGNTGLSTISDFAALNSERAQLDAQQRGEISADLLQQQFDAELAGLNGLLSEKLISEDEFAKQKELLETQFAKSQETIQAGADRRIAEAQNKSARIEKSINLAQAAINTAVAVSKVVANPIAAIAAGAAGAAQIAIIAATPIPQRARGGYFDVLGEEDQRKYSAQYIGPHAGGMLPNSPSLVLASEQGAEYYVPNPLLRNPAVADHVRIIESIRQGKVTQRAIGGFAGTPEQAAPGAATTTSTDQVKVEQQINVNRQLLTAINRLNTNLEAGIRAVIDDDGIDDLNERQELLGEIRGTDF